MCNLCHMEVLIWDTQRQEALSEKPSLCKTTSCQPSISSDMAIYQRFQMIYFIRRSSNRALSLLLGVLVSFSETESRSFVLRKFLLFTCLKNLQNFKICMYTFACLHVQTRLCLHLSYDCTPLLDWTCVFCMTMHV